MINSSDNICYLNQIKKHVQSIIKRKERFAEQYQLANTGIIVCRKIQRIENISVHDPSLTIVLSGTKNIYW